MTLQRLLELMDAVDRRVIFVLVFLCVLLPLLLGKGKKVDVKAPVQSAYDAVEALQPGDVLMVTIDYDATSMPELQPMLEAILRHAFRKGVRVLMTGQLPLGLPLGQMALERIAGDLGKTYGVDYVNLGYRPGMVAVMVAIGREIRDMFDVDFQGTKVDDLPMMREIHNYDDIDLLLCLAHGSTIDYWILYANGRFGQKIIGGTTAVSAPAAYVYLQAGQLAGLIGGLRGAAEYETLIDTPGTGILGMPAPSASHVLVIILVFLGNLGFFAGKLLRRKEA